MAGSVFFDRFCARDSKPSRILRFAEAVGVAESLSASLFSSAASLGQTIRGGLKQFETIHVVQLTPDSLLMRRKQRVDETRKCGEAREAQ